MPMQLKHFSQKSETSNVGKHRKQHRCFNKFFLFNIKTSPMVSQSKLLHILAFSSLPSVFWLVLLLLISFRCADASMCLLLGCFFVTFFCPQEKIEIRWLVLSSKTNLQAMTHDRDLNRAKKESDNHQIASNWGQTATITSPAHHASVIFNAGGQ